MLSLQRNTNKIRLGGEFAGILRVDVSERTVASFEKSLAALTDTVLP